MKTLTRNKKRVEYVDSELSKEQLEQLMPMLEEIKYRRENGLEKCYTEEEVHKGLLQMIEEAKKKNEL